MREDCEGCIHKIITYSGLIGCDEDHDWGEEFLVTTCKHREIDREKENIDAIMFLFKRLKDGFPFYVRIKGNHTNHVYKVVSAAITPYGKILESLELKIK